jgi:CRP-like cAMP-binding protein
VTEQGGIHINYKLSPELSSDINGITARLDLKAGPRILRGGQEIISEGRRATPLFIVLEGIAISYRILRDGQRQILSIILPGDFAGAPGCFFQQALYSIRTLTPVTVLAVPVTRLSALIDTDPRAAAKFFWALSCDTAVWAERLISVGRRSAIQRVAHFLLELNVRMGKLRLAEANSFRLPLTQEILSDALGLSVPYVNRVLQQLKTERLLYIKDQEVVIENIEELATLADFEPAYLTPLSLADFTVGA